METNSIWWPRLVAGMLLAIPVLAGIAVAMKWPDVNANYYVAVAQVIAILFVAIAVEFMAGERRVWEDKPDQWILVGSLTVSWFGLFGCIRAMLHGGTALTSGLAAAGLMSASVLVSLALMVRLHSHGLKAPTELLILPLVLPPVLLLIVL